MMFFTVCTITIVIHLRAYFQIFILVYFGLEVYLHLRIITLHVLGVLMFTFMTRQTSMSLLSTLVFKVLYIQLSYLFIYRITFILKL